MIRPATLADFMRIAEIYNISHTPFLSIYSPEELNAYGDERETAESIAIMAAKKNYLGV